MTFSDSKTPEMALGNFCRMPILALLDGLFVRAFWCHRDLWGYRVYAFEL